jgi:hypothetical protein
MIAEPPAIRSMARPVRLLGHSLVATLAVASLQREAAHCEPHYGPGRVIGTLELALTPRWPPCSPSLASRFLVGQRGVRHG